MNRFVLTSFALCGAMAGIVHAQDAHIDATRDYEMVSGVITTENDGTFNYQGYLEVDGAPANGMYSFRFEAFDFGLVHQDFREIKRWWFTIL